MAKITLREDQGQYIADVTREFGDTYQKTFSNLDEASTYIKGFSEYCDQKGYRFDFEDLIHPIRNRSGRPSLGTTKKVSITLPDEVWEQLNGDKGQEPMSAFLRDLIMNHYQSFRKKF